MELGEALVEELTTERGIDTLSRWMAHYVAEQIETAKSASGVEKAEAAKRCFETILKLWEQRANFPRKYRPYEQFESIFSALANLDPESGPRRPTPSWKRAPVSGDQEDESEVEKWLAVAQDIDYGTSTLIRFCLSQACEAAESEGVRKWLQKSSGIGTDHEAQAIEQLFNFADEFSTGEEDDAVDEAKQKRLESVLDSLEWFEGAVRALLEEQDAVES